MKPNTTTFELTCSSGTFTFLRPQSSDALLDSLLEEDPNNEDSIPYWAELWPSSFTALEYLPTVLSKEHPIFEIGAGLGVVSTVLAKEGFTLIASDFAEDSCWYMQQNALVNKTSFEVLCSDWRTPALSSLFETIIGIDILYESRWIEPVLLQIDTNLSTVGKAYIYDPHRPFRADFIEALKKHPTLDLAHTIQSPSQSGNSTIDCYIISRPSTNHGDTQ